MTEIKEKPLNVAGSVTRQSIELTIKKLEWQLYEVDPEWKSFCEFGPDDIGGVWEQLGVIRKRQTPQAVLVPESVMKQLEVRMASDVFGGDPERFGGIPLYSLPVISPSVFYFKAGCYE